MIDLDHNATTPLAPEVVAAMRKWLDQASRWRNPSSVHQAGQATRAMLEAARRNVAHAVGAEPLDVTFCSGGTEADALALVGAARWLRSQRRPCGLLTSPLEHAAVLGSADLLRAQGHAVIELAVDERGRFTVDGLVDTLRQHPEVGLVSLAAVNHEIGNVYDTPGLVEAAKHERPDVLFHCDAVQALGKVPVDFAAWGVDMMSISAHKIHGPMGAGALVHRRELSLLPLYGGGGQERGRRPGTESLLSLHGFGVAAGLLDEHLERYRRHVPALCERLRQGIVERFGAIARIVGDHDSHVGNTLAVAFAGCSGELIMMNLDLMGVAVSTGSACSVGRVEPSPVALALGLSPAEALGVVRFSLGVDNDVDQIDRVLDLLPDIIQRVRVAGLPTDADRFETALAQVATTEGP